MTACPQLSPLLGAAIGLLSLAIPLDIGTLVLQVRRPQEKIDAEFIQYYRTREDAAVADYRSVKL